MSTPEPTAKEAGLPEAGRQQSGKNTKAKKPASPMQSFLCFLWLKIPIFSRRIYK
jgi:hypothetical protein